ncbi:MAG: tetratricopeptide repeat protein, partial [Bacteroidales bacterium]|nr:tetratricopeptide repeat protein [Bacteroidales bacterium]
YKSTNNNRKPQALYEKALLLNPNNKYLMQLLASTYFTTEQYDKAKELYLRACDQDTSVFLLKQAGLCCEKLLQHEEAIFLYQRAMAKDPDDYQPFFRLANLYKNRREYDPGIAVADSFLRRHPDNNDINRLSGYMHYLNQDFNRSVEHFQQCLNQGDTTEFADKYMGYSYFKLNDFEHAIPCLERVFAKDSSDAELCYVLGLSHDPPKNIRYFRASINLNMPVVDILSLVHLDLSLALTKNRQYNEALAALQQAIELTPRDPAVVYKLALHYDNWMDDKPMALKYYQEFLSMIKDPGQSIIITSTSVLTEGDLEHAGRRIKDIETSFNQAPAVVNDTITNR